MPHPLSQLTVVEAGDISQQINLEEIADGMVNAFEGRITGYELTYHEVPKVIDEIDALFLTKILKQIYDGQVLGITNLDLKSDNGFFDFIFGGKNSKNYVAVVSTKRLTGQDSMIKSNPNSIAQRVLKVAIHEVGHNFGLLDHYEHVFTQDSNLCPMSRGPYNKFGEIGYIRSVIDARGYTFCDTCLDIMRYKTQLA